MDGRLTVEIVFLLSIVTTLLLILRRPYLRVRAGRRSINISSFFLGSLLGPLMLLALGLMRYTQILAGLNGYGQLNPFGILVLFLSMVFLSIFLDITGFFECWARAALRFAGSDGRRLFFTLYWTVSFLTIFTSNDIVILTFTPFIFYFTRAAGLPSRPYLISEFFAANTWSMMLYIGNPTNILLASAFSLKFEGYLLRMAVPTIVAGLTNLTMLYAIFRRDVCRPMRPGGVGRPLDAITDVPGAVLGVVALVGCILALCMAPYLGVEMWTVSLVFAMSLVTILAIRDSYARFLSGRLRNSQGSLGRTMRLMPWPVVPFILSMFISVEALRAYGIMTEVGSALAGIAGGSTLSSVLLYGFSSALSANVVNNIPMTVGFVGIISTLPTRAVLPAVLATVVGSNLGANITPLGALAGILWMSILRGKAVDLSFWDFVRYGILVTPVSLILCLLVLGIQLQL